MGSLATKYRPNSFNDVIGQKYIIKILKQQIETNNIKNCYIFHGKSGTGKTTLARIFASVVNDNAGTPIEIDAASQGSLEQMRDLAMRAADRAIDCTYKVIILDECQNIGRGSGTSSNKAWQPLLRLFENMPKYTIFILCTTDIQKVPEAIYNRCQCYNFTNVSIPEICERLRYICNKENFKYTEEALMQLSKLANGSVRQAIANLEKVHDYNNTINMQAVLESIGDFTYDVYFKLLNALLDKDTSTILSVIDKLDFDGTDLSLFMDQFIEFILDINKYNLFKTFELIKIPEIYKNDIDYVLNINVDCGVTKYYNRLLSKLLKIKITLKNDPTPKNTLEILLVN